MNFFQAQTISKKKNSIFCELENLKNMDFIFCKLPKPRKDAFNFWQAKKYFNFFVNLKTLAQKAILLTITFTKGNLK